MESAMLEASGGERGKGEAREQHRSTIVPTNALREVATGFYNQQKNGERGMAALQRWTKKNGGVAFSESPLYIVREARNSLEAPGK